MRVDPNISSLMTAGIDSSEQALESSIQQVSTGQRVSVPSDDPYAMAADIQSLAASASVDSYTRNGNAVLSQVQMADSVLSNVVSEMTQAVTLGTEGADGSMNSQNRASVASQVQGILSNIVSQANTSFNGVSLFAGTATPASVFVPDTSSPDGYSYQGNDDVDQATIGDGLKVATNIPGDQIFTNPGGSVLGSLSQLVTALNSGSTDDIATATAAVSSALTQVSSARMNYAVTVNQINSQESYLSQETISLSSQQQSLTGIDMATAISNMTQAQTAHSAVLAAAAKVLPTSLLDYLN
jgi:flagellar hook-associated protein 3 FlgL